MGAGARGWGARIALGLGLWLVYVANGREIGAGDTLPAVLQPVGIARGDGLALDRFGPALRAIDPTGGTSGQYSYYARTVEGHLHSRYPVMPALVALPFVLPQLALLDAWRPGWDATPGALLRYARWTAKNASAAIVAIAAVVLFEVLRRLGLGRVALPATLVAALGSPLWMSASQSPWQHGPAVLALVTATLCLLAPRRPATLVGAGCALAALMATRFTTAVFVLPVLAWVAWRRARDLAWVLPPIVLVAAVVVAWNLHVFGTLLGGLTELESERLVLQDVPATWGSLRVGAAGTLFSPNRGLLVFCPWVAVTLVLLPFLWRRLVAAPVVPVLLAGMVPYLVIYALYSGWWGGWVFGPRYASEAIPVLAILYAFALDATRTRARWARTPLWAAGAFAIALQAYGAAFYPSSWNATPVPIGRQPARVWDWRDTEVSRGLAEGPRAREFGLLPW